MIDSLTGLQSTDSAFLKLEEYIGQEKEIGYIFFEIVDFQELQNIHGEEPVYNVLSFIGEIMGIQRGKLYREDDLMVSDPKHPGRLILLMFSPPRHKLRFSDADLKLVSSRILQKLKALVQDICSYDEIGDNIYFNSGFSLIKGYELSQPERTVFQHAQHEASLQATNERVMANLISNISHELRTPLTCIKGYAESLLEGAMYDDGLCEKFLKIISNESQRLEKLINDLLDLSMIDSRQVQMFRREIDICDLLKKIRIMLQPYAKKQGVRLNCHLPEKPILIDIDEDRIRQVIIILLDNAIKYSKGDGIVSSSIKTEGKELLISIEDNGIGIPETEKDRIFERFYRLEPKKQLKKEGRGLGLSIAKYIIEAHGGNITLDSVYGKGSTFTIHLPENLPHEEDSGKLDKSELEYIQNNYRSE